MKRNCTKCNLLCFFEIKNDTDDDFEWTWFCPQCFSEGIGYQRKFNLFKGITVRIVHPTMIRQEIICLEKLLKI